MLGALKPGQQLRCLGSRACCVVEHLIDEGGQGGVYQARVDGQPYALKWYHDHVLRLDRGLPRRLQVAVDRGAPSANFLWPFELVTRPDGAQLGYLMPLRTPSYQKIHAVMAQRVRPSFRVLAMTGWQLTEALLALHAKGLAYQDLNAGNVFFDAESGRIEVCDNDNVDIDGAPSVMGGVWEFQAPEVVLRQAGPSRATDLHSLAVMLFRILHIGHPLLGKRELAFSDLREPAALRRLYGTEARFVFDPADDSNRPLPEHHGPVLGHWAIYPQHLRELFTRAFTEGLYDPVHGRVQETEWRRALRQLHDAVYTCPGCGQQNFHDPQRLADKQPTFACWHCGQALPSLPPRLGVRRAGQRPNEAPAHVLVLEPGALLFGHHLGARDPNVVVGRVAATDDGLVLHHEIGPLSAELPPWQPQDADGTAWPAVPPGHAVTLRKGLRLAFGAARGEVKW